MRAAPKDKNTQTSVRTQTHNDWDQVVAKILRASKANRKAHGKMGLGAHKRKHEGAHE